MSVNRVVLVGRLTRDPELRQTTTGRQVCNFGIAVQKQRKPQDGSPDADFFNIVAWGQTADFVTQYLHKGRLVAVDGRLQARRYTTQDGAQRDIVEVVADNVQGLDRPRDDQAGGGGGGGGSYSRGGDSGGGSYAPQEVSAAPDIDEYDPFADE